MKMQGVFIGYSQQASAFNTSGLYPESVVNGQVECHAAKSYRIMVSEKLCSEHYPPCHSQWTKMTKPFSILNAGVTSMCSTELRIFTSHVLGG